jgi:hypothetical protein
VRVCGRFGCCDAVFCAMLGGEIKSGKVEEGGRRCCGGGGRWDWRVPVVLRCRCRCQCPSRRLRRPPLHYRGNQEAGQTGSLGCEMVVDVVDADVAAAAAEMCSR